MTKVLHVLSYSEPNLSGYTQRSKYLVEHQRKSGLQPIVVTSDRHRSGLDTEVINGVTYYRSQIPHGPLSALAKRSALCRDVLLMLQLRRDILRIATQHAVDVIHAHSPVLCGLPALSAAKRLRRPVVYEVRALWEDAAVDQGKTTEGSVRYALSRALETFVLRRADRVVVICEGLKQDVLRRGIPEGRIAVMPNGVDTRIFTPRGKAQALLDRYGLNGHKVIGFLGSFFRFEGIGTLLQAIPLIQARNSHIKVMIVGSGHQEAELKRLVEQHRLSDAVIFTGRVNHEEVTAFYSIMDVLVYPRLQQRLTELVTPLKPLEAMALGKTVVASDVGGLRELVQDRRTGLLFRAGDPQDLAEKCSAALHDPQLSEQLALQARAYVERERDWSLICRKYLDLYRGLAG